MRKTLVFTPLVSILAIGGLSGLSAQDTSSAVLAGRVASQDDQPLQGVNVLVESPSLLGVRQAVTDASGYFRVYLLPNGEYTITFRLDGYLTRKLTMRLVAGQTSNASTKLTSINVQEATIEITAARNAQVDKTDTVVQTSFSSEYLEAITGRGLAALGRLTPGINTYDLTTSGNLRIRGGTGHSTKALVDGMTVTEQYGGYISNSFNMSDLIESVSVIQSPLNARYGNSDGGIITMVTSKGSNTFTGTFRVNASRGNWGVNNYTNYPRRDGTTATPTGWRTTDAMTRSYELTIKGPIWKDHITFAYGANLTPTTYGTKNAYIRWYDNGDGTFGRAADSVGTYFMQQNPNLPGYGDVIRKAEMYSGNDPYNRIIPTSSYSKNNQFSAIAQITPSHQVEWNYSQRDSISTNPFAGGDNSSEVGHDWDRYIDGTRAWSVAYKGVIGSYGVLEARFGRTYIYNENGFGMANPSPIRTFTTNTYIPKDPNGNRNDPNNYWANGMVEADARQTRTQWLYDAANVYNAQADFYYWTHNGPWAAPSSNGTGGNTATVLNYQHFLNTSKGSHIIDLGLQRDSYDWQKSPAGPMLRFYSPGHIARNLGPGDIWNSRGGASANSSAYADKFIVYDMSKAWLSDISPWGVERYKIIDMPVYDPTRYNNGTHELLGSDNYPRYPMVIERFGTASGEFTTNMMSYYINDLWSINDHHSVQGGLRIDNFALIDGGDKVFSYIQPTLRFEYKWDIHGDQSRMVNVSWGQFHSQVPTGLFRPLIAAPGADNRKRYWNVPNPDGSRGNQYLVSREQVLDLKNYGMVGPDTLFGGDIYRVDPNWKAPISTEYQAGFRRNLSGGGYWRATFVYRTWINDFDFYPDPGDIFKARNGQLNMRRYLRNNEGYTRNYNGIELEWDYPIHKRFSFGGSYTFSRLMSNVPGNTDIASGVGDAPQFNLSSWMDWLFDGSREAWAPVAWNGPEHFIKSYMLFDISSGKIKSTVSFTLNYGSGTPNRRSFAYNFGYPVDYEPRYSQLLLGTAGGTRPGTTGTSGFNDGVSNNRSIPFEVMSTTQDGWELNMRYLLTVPLARNISWLSTITISNPFNHRGIGAWFSTSNAQAVTVPKQLTGASTVNVTFPYGGTGPQNRGVWLAYYDTATGLNDMYVSRMSGRSFGVQTGLRF